jgi:hypothetical protein
MKYKQQKLEVREIDDGEKNRYNLVRFYIYHQHENSGIEEQFVKGRWNLRTAERCRNVELIEGLSEI